MRLFLFLNSQNSKYFLKLYLFQLTTFKTYSNILPFHIIFVLLLHKIQNNMNSKREETIELLKRAFEVNEMIVKKLIELDNEESYDDIHTINVPVLKNATTFIEHETDDNERMLIRIKQMEYGRTMLMKTKLSDSLAKKTVCQGFNNAELYKGADGHVRIRFSKDDTPKFGGTMTKLIVYGRSSSNNEVTSYRYSSDKFIYQIMNKLNIDFRNQSSVRVTLTKEEENADKLSFILNL